MKNERDERGRFLQDNQVRKKPILCPHCEKRIKILGYHYLAKENQDKPLENGGKQPLNKDWRYTMNPETKTKFCKKLRYGNPLKPTIILGIILKDDGNFIDFQTARHRITISKDVIITLEDTKEVFNG